METTLAPRRQALRVNLTTAMFENLSDKLQRAFKNLRGQGSVTDENIGEALREIRVAHEGVPQRKQSQYDRRGLARALRAH